MSSSDNDADAQGAKGGETPAASRWYLGTELSERILALRRHGGPVRTAGERARRRAERWRAQEPFVREEWWTRRLAADGLTEEDFLSLLGLSPEALRSSMESAPAWLQEIERAYVEPVSEPFSWPERAGGPERSAFLALAEPLVRSGLARLLRGLGELETSFPGALFEPETLGRELLGHLPTLLTPLLSRTLVVELHAAQLQERLTGDTPRARFQDFAHSLRRREVALEILARYPVLARQLVECIAHWERAGVELLRHFREDAPELQRRFSGGVPLGRLVEAEGGVSDSHRGGRGVFLLRFESGTRLVYKPRSLATEAAFQRLLSWLAQQGLEPAPRTLEVLDRGDHGWVEFVTPAPCSSAEEVRRFYLRQGGFIALLYVLDATDFHHENLIASGEHPVLVDLETLFHPPVRVREQRDTERHPGAPLGESVLKSGLLPQRTWGTRERPGVDISGLGSSAGQLTPQAFLMPVERGTDRMRFERRQVEVPGSHNRPRLEGVDASLLDYADALSEGFSRMYRLLLRRREALLAGDGPLAAFAEAPVRVVFRHTSVYGSLLLESFHPHALGDALERQCFLEHLWKGAVERPFLASLIPFELEDLLRGDVPLFTTLPGTRHVWTSSGARLEDFLETPGLERVRRRVALLSDEDLERQRWIIHRALDALRLGEPGGERPSYPVPEPGERAGREELLAAARRIGEKLVGLSLRGPEEAHWLTLDYADAGGWQLAHAGADLYQGLGGIALFLGYLGAATGEESFTRTARMALCAQEHQIELDASQVRGLGLLNGWGGVLYGLTHLGVLWADARTLDRAEHYLERLPALIERDEMLDLGVGSAGCLIALLTLAEHRPSELLWKAARACGERLLDSARRQERGMGWVVPLAGQLALAGMSHGAAGISLALLRLAAATGDERFGRMAREGIEFERGLFSAAERNWPDLRAGAAELAGPHGGGMHFMTAWCHGAPGIGLARLSGLPMYDDARVREELAHAVATTLAGGFGQNHSLCHGDLGNLDFLLEAARVLGDEALEHQVYQRARTVLRVLDERGCLFGLQRNIETPGLMVGLAGIGYGLARLAAPERLPSLLALAPPGHTIPKPKGWRHSEQSRIQPPSKGEPP
ncbi:lantibiotic modification protein [Cystobacter fuscus]|uniref:Lantibiotic modification protein n=1 Tax=Cystobacter fuscus TaxID=43 RepID=A0A250JD03_9BACT|nr:type 2 lanthipeptide synthetase LanM family protein [Cystobacter fuscus]ATB41789.1 lantibiotic modification protein [Cystobacter fuscus]